MANNIAEQEGVVWSWPSSLLDGMVRVLLDQNNVVNAEKVSRFNTVGTAAFALTAIGQAAYEGGFAAAAAELADRVESFAGSSSGAYIGGGFGAFLGGPVGAFVGASVGSYVGGNWKTYLHQLNRYNSAPFAYPDNKWEMDYRGIGDAFPYAKTDPALGQIVSSYTGINTGLDTPSELNAGTRPPAVPGSLEITDPTPAIQLYNLPISTPYNFAPIPSIVSPVVPTPPPVEPLQNPFGGYGNYDGSGSGLSNNDGSHGSAAGGYSSGGSYSSGGGGQASSTGSSRDTSGSKSSSGGYASTPSRGPTPGSRPSGSSNGGLRDNQNKGSYGGDWGLGAGSSFRGSPVLIDLSGNGLDVDDLSSSAKFVDLDGSGYQHRTAWAGRGTGVLVLDADGDGRISRSSEFAFTEWDSSATTDFEALRHVFDTNGNGKLDPGDARWSEFNVELDGQLVSLDDLGITSIDLTPVGSGQSFADGSAITGTTTFTRADGSNGIAGDAVLAADNNKYLVSTTSTTLAGGSTQKDILAYGPDGSLAFRNLVTTSADGNSVQTSFDDDGNGTFDRSQTTSVSVDVNGFRTKTVSNFNADGSLADRTTVVTSADRLTTATTLDQNGDGAADERQTFVRHANGSSTTTTQSLSADGTVLAQVVIEATADGLSKTSTIDLNGDGTNDEIVTETTVVAADGSRTKTVADCGADGTLLASTVTLTSADNRAKTVSEDTDGNGTVDTRTVTVTTVAASGDVTAHTTVFNGDHTVRSEATSVTSADGVSKTVSSDLDGDGAIDLVQSEYIDANGAKTKTMEYISVDGTRLSRASTLTRNEGKSEWILVDTDGDGGDDEITLTLPAEGGTRMKATHKLNADGSTIASSISETSANGLSTTTRVDTDGNGSDDRVITDVIVTNADGSRAETVTTKSASGAIIGKTVTTTTADSLSQTLQSDLNGDGTFDLVAADVITLNGDGTRTEAVTVRSADGTLTGQTTTVVSADRRTASVTTDGDGDGNADSVQTRTVYADGHSETAHTDYAANGTALATRRDTVSADALTTTSTVDVNGDGISDRVSRDTTVISADGSRTKTMSLSTGNGTLLNRQTIVTSGNGLSVAAREDVNGDGAIDRQASQITTLNSDGSITKAVSHIGGTTLTDRQTTTVSANGLSTRTDIDADGNGTVDRHLTSTRVVNANGSTQTTEATRAANGTLVSTATNNVSADGKTATKTFDLDGNGVTDVQETIAISPAGLTADTVETYKPNGTLDSRSVVSTSANGLSKTASSDLNGDGIFERVVTDTTSLDSNGGQTRMVSQFGAGNVLTARTTTTVSADGLTKTAAFADGSGTTVRSVSDVTVLNADGGTTETISYSKADGSLESRTVTTVAAHRLWTAVTVDLDGDGVVDQQSTTTRKVNGSVEQRLSDLSAGGITKDTKTITVTADGLEKTVDYDSDGNGTVDKETTSVTVLNANGSKTTTLQDLVAGPSGLVVKNKTVVDTSADRLSISTKWDTTGSGSFDKNQTDVTTLNADGSRSRTINTFNGSALASRHLVITSANGRSVTEQWDLMGSGSYGQTATDLTVLNVDGTTTRTITSSKSDGTTISRTTVISDASGKVVASSDECAGFSNQTRTDTREVLADGAARETLATTDASGHLVDKTTTLTSADKQTVTVHRDANGDGIVDQRQQSVTANSGILTSTTTDFNADGTVKDRSVRTVSADGRHTTITWDFDGNGSIERQRSVDDSVHADGSRTTITTDIDLPTGTVAARTTVETSADGRTITASRDVNGDGTVDQVETVTTDATGASVSVVTNNATARNAAYLSQGGIYWTQSIAARSETTSSLDGRTKTIRYDYDGDGVFETTMQQMLQIDGSVVTDVTESVAGGAIKAKGTISTSADGRITKLSKDSDNNGTVDHTETSVTHADGSVTLTKVDLDSSGSATQTVVDTVNALGSLTSRITSDGLGRTTSQIAIAADGSSVTTIFDAASGQQLSVSRASKAGLRTSATLYDPLNAQPWTRVEQQFDAAGKKTSETQYNDDGTRAEVTYTASGAQQKINYYSAANVLSGTTDFDTTNTNAWSQMTKTFNAAGQLTSQVTTNDDATKVQLSYDPANTAAWATYQQNFNAAGQMTFVDQTNDNGTHNTVTYDVANTQTWSRYEQTKDVSGNVLNQTNFNDNGTQAIVVYDVANQQSWSRYEQTKDTAGRLVAQTNYNDNGTKDAFSFDVANTATWSNYQETFNAAGQRTWFYQINDNGTRYGVSYDPANAADWSYLEYTYDASARLTNQTNHYDNGSTAYYTWDVTNAQSWSSVVNVYNAASQQTAQYVYSDDPSSYTITTFDTAGGTNQWNRTVAEYVGGKITKSTLYYDDGWYDVSWYSQWGGVKATGSYNPHGVPYNHHNGSPLPQGSQHPVLLDLDGDQHVDFRPLDLANMAASPEFDWDGDGIANPTAWVGPNDGFLAIDLGANREAGADGLIDQGRELAFADWATDEQIAANGGSVSDLDGLRLVFDSNHDNILDVQDDRWSEFRVWRDANQNGITDQGELQTMSEAGIKLVNLLHTPEGAQAFADGSAITGTSAYETEAGGKFLVGDATLAYRAA